MWDTILGLDIGGSKIAVVEGDHDANILQRRAIANGPDIPFEAAFRSMCESAEELVRLSQAAGRCPSTMSVSVGGPLDLDAGLILSPPNLPGWHGVPLRARLSERLGLPTFVEHDGNAGALAEYTFGAGRGTTNLVFLTLGTGLGAGIILDGKIYHGSTDTAGEVGHIRMAESGPVAYGSAGSWEGLCSAVGLAKLAPMRYPDLWPQDVAASVVIEDALKGVPQACALVEETGNWLGRGLSILVDVLNPDMVVIGTLGVVLGDMLLEPARRVLAETALPVAGRACRVVPAQLGERLGDVAALMAAISGGRRNLRGGVEAPAVPAGLDGMWEGLRLRKLTMAHLSEKMRLSSQVLIEALRQGHKILIFGNGGSAAEAQHLAAELQGRYVRNRVPLRAIALTADTCVGTCISNDFGFEELFARQVRALADSGDIAIGISTSGHSGNVTRGLEAARDLGAVTIGLVGKSRMRDVLVDFELDVPSDCTARIQEEHMAIIHCLCEAIDAAFAEDA